MRSVITLVIKLNLTKPPLQFYSQSLELVTLVIVINAVIGEFSGEDLR